MRTLILTVVAVAATPMIAVPAGASAAAQLALNPASVTPGTTVTATGTGFPTVGGNQIRIVVGQTHVATVPYQPPNFTATFAAPALTPGFHPVTACVASNNVCSTAPGTSAQARLQIQARPSPAPPSSKPKPKPSGPAVPGDLQITLDPVCCDPPGSSKPFNLVGAGSPTPEPNLKNPGAAPSFPDLYVLGIEVTQNIQDIYSKMPLVAGRKTIVRVHPRANTGSWGPVDGAILLKRGGKEEIVYPINGPIFVGLGTDRTELDSALNFVIEPKWYAEGQLGITALVWAYGPSTLDDKEPNPQNNMMATSVNFRVARKPNIHVVPLDDGTGP